MKLCAIGLALSLLAAPALAATVVELSAVDGPDFVQDITVTPGTHVVLAYRVQDVADLAWWDVVLDQRYVDDPDCEFIDVWDGLPDWRLATNGQTGAPDHYYRANSYSSIGSEFTGTGVMGFIEVLPHHDVSITAVAFELVSGTVQLIEHDLGDVTVNIHLGAGGADAGEDAYGYESRGAQPYVATLDGSGSVGASTYLWEQVAGVGVAIRRADEAVADLDAPQWDGATELTKTEARLRFRLTINVGTPQQDSDEVEIYIRIPGDANGDDVVNAFDIALLRVLDPSADFNGDTAVNAFDVSILRLNSGRRRLLD